MPRNPDSWWSSSSNWGQGEDRWSAAHSARGRDDERDGQSWEEWSASGPIQEHKSVSSMAALEGVWQHGCAPRAEGAQLKSGSKSLEVVHWNNLHGSNTQIKVQEPGEHHFVLVWYRKYKAICMFQLLKRASPEVLIETAQQGTHRTNVWKRVRPVEGMALEAQAAIRERSRVQAQAIRRRH